MSLFEARIVLLIGFIVVFYRAGSYALFFSGFKSIESLFTLENSDLDVG